MISQNLNLRSKNFNLDVKSGNVKERAYVFSLTIIKFINKLPNNRAFWVISDQLLRAATSIGANLIEAQAASSRKEFINYYHIALKSANEAIYWLSLLGDSYPNLENECDDHKKEAREICNMIASSLLTLKGKKI